MYLLLNILVLLFLFSHSLCGSNLRVGNENKPSENSRLTVTYIANEGVLISSGQKQVLIDGLHREYKPDYAFPPEALLGSLEFARPPYNQIDMLLVTHIHLDHFHPRSVGLHLKNNPSAILVSSEQVAESLKKEFGRLGEIEARVRRVTPQWKTNIALNAAGINLKVLGLRHANPQFSWIQNLGYLIEINGKKLLHIGDADMTDENFSSFRLSQEGIDIAFIPYWYMLSDKGRSLVREQIRPKQIVAVHISPAEAESMAEQIRKVFPEAIAFTRIMESKSF
jgi:L-ascorbate metabolism protein UlaG (beta-lactamase superfamily)